MLLQSALGISYFVHKCKLQYKHLLTSIPIGHSSSKQSLSSIKGAFNNDVLFEGLLVLLWQLEVPLLPLLEKAL
jgi:hypothetical protein